MFKAKHISGKYNIIADRLSCFNLQEARAAARWLDKSPTVWRSHFFLEPVHTQICSRLVNITLPDLKVTHPSPLLHQH